MFAPKTCIYIPIDLLPILIYRLAQIRREEGEVQCLLIGIIQA